ncbi:type IV toxin-antitoxin system AbiEi family antitoxin domain-containing protein [Rhabdothermincola sediminis]|uniref:type IV toxin-antitoxin system AbiEi family antitoxin domain-containing protein n=1 Tax=Rhabdothermincola sediminis TaxID=2751370 RepID=UPI001AA04B2C|nr:type IV toxin-antitoxin system AbiEi family antitoxin domain-containing protein [Rhabdothermincola sediminis]
MDHDHTIAELATHQHAVVAMRQLRALGVPRWLIDQRVRRGQLVRLSPRVLRVAGCAPTPHQLALRELLVERPIDEVQSDLYHSSVSDRARDAQRRRRLEGAGWIVVPDPRVRCLVPPGSGDRRHPGGRRSGSVAPRGRVTVRRRTIPHAELFSGARSGTADG